MGDTRADMSGGPQSRHQSSVPERGRVLSVRELAREYVVIGITRDAVVVRRKSDGRAGTLRYRHGPTVFFAFCPSPVG